MRAAIYATLAIVMAAQLTTCAATAEAAWEEAQVTDDGRYSWAWADKDGQVGLGYRCERDGACTAQIQVNMTCNDDNVTPIMVGMVVEGNETVYAHADAKCFFQNEKGAIMTLLLSSNYQSTLIEQHMVSTSVMTIIIPGDDGTIRVERFDMTGSKKAMEDVERIVGQSASARQQTGYVEPTESGTF